MYLKGIQRNNRWEKIIFLKEILFIWTLKHYRIIYKRYLLFLFNFIALKKRINIVLLLDLVYCIQNVIKDGKKNIPNVYVYMKDIKIRLICLV